MHKLSIFLGLVIFKGCFKTCEGVAGCGVFDNCKFFNWEPWQPCSVTCGGGTKERIRAMCCWPSKRYSGTDCTYIRCGVQESDYHDISSCGTVCFNGGTFHGGRCECSIGLGGSCCELLGEFEYTVRAPIVIFVHSRIEFFFF